MSEDRKPTRGRFDLCAFCPDLCLDRCPVVAATGSVTFSPYAKMLHGWLLENGRIPPSREMAELFYQCTGCLSCHEACGHDVDVETSLFGLRAELVEQGMEPYERELFTVSTEEMIEAQAKAIPKRFFVPEAQAVLFPGCHALLQRPGVIKDALSVLKGLKIEFVGASDRAAVCCGYPLHAGGFTREFVENAERVSAALQPYRLVVALSACCVHTMRNLFAAAGIDHPPRVTSVLDLAAPLVMRTQRDSLGLNLGYHDSCFLGRHLGQYDMPREVLTHINGMPPIESRLHRGDAPCCGAGGGWEKTSPVLAGFAARAVGGLAGDAGADILVSACTTCSCHLASAGMDSVDVTDILSLMARWLKKRRRRR